MRTGPGPVPREADRSCRQHTATQAGARGNCIGGCFFFFFFFYIYLFLRNRVRQSVSGGGAEREGDTESEAGSRLRAVSTEPDAGLEPTNCEIMT